MTNNVERLNVSLTTVGGWLVMFSVVLASWFSMRAELVATRQAVSALTQQVTTLDARTQEQGRTIQELVVTLRVKEIIK